MYEQDYIMRLIKEIVRALLKLLFSIDTASPSAELLEDTKEQETLNNLLDMADAGKINEAENKIYELLSEERINNLETALLFYSYLNDKSDEFLEENNFSREEVITGIKEAAARFGLEGVAEEFLTDL